MWKLDGVEGIACMTICGAMRLSPTQKTEELLRFLPLDLLIMLTAARSAFASTAACNGWPVGHERKVLFCT